MPRFNKLPPGEPSWKWRRLVIFSVTIWGIYQLHILVNENDSRLNETIAFGWQVLIGALVLGYTGFATAQDIAAIWRTRRGNPYSPPPSDEPGP
jgi:hypothetical protein